MAGRIASAITFLAVLVAAAPALAVPQAQAAFVERRGLLETDARCNLFSPDVRMAVEAGAGQAGSALLRAGWPRARLTALESAAAEAARARPCDDPQTTLAAAQARDAYDAWTREPNMSFAGAQRAWRASRWPDAEGWMLRQDLTPAAAVFGVRGRPGAESLCLMIPQAALSGASAGARLLVRDPARADASFLELPGRTTSGLAAGAPPPQAVHEFWARDRRVERGASGPQRIVFTFPDDAFAAILALDPRESVAIRVGDQQLLVEVGDLAAARAFLAAHPQR